MHDTCIKINYNLEIFNRRTRSTRIFEGIAGIVQKVWVIFRKPHSFSLTQNSFVKLNECGLFNSSTIGWLPQRSIFRIMFQTKVCLVCLNTLTDKGNNKSLNINLLYY
jgi:hypothetical protein